jgi:hypothetical protein
VLVNNGRYIGPGHMDLFEDTPIELIEQMFLATSSHRSSSSALPADWKRQGGGIVINITSSAGQTETPQPIGKGGWGLGYSLTKAAFSRMVSGLAKELRPYDVAVIGLMPGFVGTERMAIELKEFGFDAIKRCRSRTPAACAPCSRRRRIRCISPAGSARPRAVSRARHSFASEPTQDYVLGRGGSEHEAPVLRAWRPVAGVPPDAAAYASHPDSRRSLLSRPTCVRPAVRLNGRDGGSTSTSRERGLAVLERAVRELALRDLAGKHSPRSCDRPRDEVAADRAGLCLPMTLTSG